MSMLLKAVDLHKTYTLGRSTVPVLHGASLELFEGSTLAIVGVSGSGKSTLLHILGGLDRPDGGAVTIQGDDLYAMSSAKRTRRRAMGIGFVFQSYNLLPEMDVLENVTLPAMALPRRGRLDEAPRDRALRLLDAVGLADRAEHRPMELSGGEQQRAALARALMNNPSLVLADEPTGNLDEGTGAHVLDCLFSLTKASGHALVLVTHNLATARSCDRVLRLEDGVLRDDVGEG